jgi:hypothetical protein
MLGLCSNNQCAKCETGSAGFTLHSSAKASVNTLASETFLVVAAAGVLLVIVVVATFWMGVLK